MKPTATDWFIVLVLVVIGVWDLLAWSTGWMPTVSATIRTWAAHYRLLPFFYLLLVALLFVHLFTRD